MNKRGIIVLIAVLLLATIWRAPGVAIHPSGAVYMPDIRHNFENAFVWGVSTLFAYFIASKVNLWFALFYVLTAFSAFYPINTEHSEKAHMLVLYGVLWYALCLRYLNSEKAIRWAINAICVIALANCIFLIMQSFQFDPLHKGIPPLWGASFDSVPNVGLMSCINGASVMLAICFPAFLRKKWCYFIPVIFLGFVLSTTFIGPLSVGVALVIFGFAKLKVRMHKLLVVLLCVSSLWAYSLVDKPDVSWRMNTWKIAIDLFPQHWVSGSGIGHWKMVFLNDDIIKAITKYRGSKQEFMAQAHNEPLQATFELGFLFPIILMGYLISTLWRFWLMRKHQWIPFLALVVILVTSGAFFPFHIALTAMVSLTWMAMLQNSLKQQHLSL